MTPEVSFITTDEALRLVTLVEFVTVLLELPEDDVFVVEFVVFVVTFVVAFVVEFVVFVVLVVLVVG